MSTVYHCQKCGNDFEYDPEYMTAEQMAKYHRCPGEWEAMTAHLPPLHDPYAGVTWEEECIAKQRGPA